MKVERAEETTMKQQEARQLRFDLSESDVWAHLPETARTACVQLLAQLLEIVALDRPDAGGDADE
jgi:hypothetical protein